MKKLRKGIIVLTIISILFIGAALGLYFLFPGITVPDFLPTFNAVKDAILGIFQNGISTDLLGLIPLIAGGILALAALISLVWIIIDLIRKRPIGILFFFIFLADAAFVSGIAYNVLHEIYDCIAGGGSFAFDMFPIVRVIYAGLAVVAYLLLIATFVVDLATGGRKKGSAPEVAPAAPAPAFGAEEAPETSPVYEEAPAPASEEAPATVEAPAPASEEAPKEDASIEGVPAEEEPVEEEETANDGIVDEPNEKPAKKKAPAKKAAAPKKADTRSTQSITLTNEDGATYAKAYHVSRRPELNKWQVKATGSDKALKLFNTQKEAIEYANQLAKSQNVSIRVHSKAGKIRKDRSSSTGGKK